MIIFNEEHKSGSQKKGKISKPSKRSSMHIKLTILLTIFVCLRHESRVFESFATMHPWFKLKNCFSM